MKLNPDIIMKENFDGGGILYDIDSKKLMSINETGLAIWKAISDGLELDDIVDSIVLDFTVSREDAKKDVLAFTEQLSSRGILQN